MVAAFDHYLPVHRILNTAIVSREDNPDGQAVAISCIIRHAQLLLPSRPMSSVAMIYPSFFIHPCLLISPVQPEMKCNTATDRSRRVT